MKASIDNATGHIIEHQSLGSAAMMLANANNAGFADVSIIDVTEEECAALIKLRDDSRKTWVEHRAEAFALKSYDEQLDMQYWDAVNGTTFWQDWRAGIKAQSPKP